MHLFNCNICFGLILVLFVSVFISGCGSNKIIMKPDPPKGNANTAIPQGNNVDYDDAVKHHFDMQSERTKQMMIRSDKKRGRNNAGMGRTWYDKLFNNSCFKNSCMVKTGHSYVTITKSKSCFLKE